MVFLIQNITLIDRLIKFKHSINLRFNAKSELITHIIYERHKHPIYAVLKFEFISNCLEFKVKIEMVSNRKEISHPIKSIAQSTMTQLLLCVFSM